jgi:hypothetical protein
MLRVEARGFDGNLESAVANLGGVRNDGNDGSMGIATINPDDENRKRLGGHGKIEQPDLTSACRQSLPGRGNANRERPVSPTSSPVIEPESKGHSRVRRNPSSANLLVPR